MKKDLISMEDLSVQEIKNYLTAAAKVEAMPLRERVQFLPGRIMATLFFEPSTRTRLSFESAMHQLGGSVIGFAEQSATSVSKGESFTDTIHTVENYSDILVIRHPGEGTARLAAQESHLPILNAGDGSNQLRLQKYFMSTDEPGKYQFKQTDDIEEAIKNCDVLYMTRIQRERFPDLVEYEKVKDSYVLTASMLKDAKEHARVLHPLPRVNEIAYDVDKTKHAGYFPQMKNGVIIRQAILLKHLGVQL
ncbi:MAG: aspartate carbamoyltransferase [Calditrichaceae bacterium]